MRILATATARTVTAVVAALGLAALPGSPVSRAEDAPGEPSVSEESGAVADDGEWVIATNNSTDNYFYAWSELSLVPVAWGRVGIVGQRTTSIRTRTRAPWR
jgi:hypothetical protein